MKKIITVLIIISIIAAILMAIFPEYTLVLFPFAIPLAFGPVSLAVNRFKLKPKTWLIIYGIAVAVCLVIFATAVHYLGPSP